MSVSPCARCGWHAGARQAVTLVRISLLVVPLCLLLSALLPSVVLASSDPSSPSVAARPTLDGSLHAAPCHYGRTQRVADIQMKSIPEASALVASQQWPGVYWTVNDAHHLPRLHAFDQDGHARGSFTVAGAQDVDWEALQLGPAPSGGWALYVGDIGDNDAKRRETMIYRLPEPRPLPAGAAPGDDQTVTAEAFRLRFPDGPHNAEAMLVHPNTGEMVVITKERGGISGVYRVPHLDSRGAVTLEWVGRVDVRDGSPDRDLVTDASIAADTRHVTVRTYSHAFEYDLADGASLGSIWGQQPRVTTLDDGPKGEGITYRADGQALMTIGEGTSPALFQTSEEC